MQSFSAKIKKELISRKIKNKCCRAMFTAGLVLFSDEPKVPDEYGKLYEKSKAEYTSHRAEILCGQMPDALRDFGCDNCPGSFISGVFAERGSVTAPKKSYHLDFAFHTENERDVFAKFLTLHFKEPSKAERRGMFTAYYKNSGDIEDFLALIGASGAMFELINTKIEKEIFADTNRRINCDSANIAKQLAASQKSVAVLRELHDRGYFGRLPAELRDIAFLRLENESLSLAELSQLTQVPLSKSGVNHRLTRAVAEAERILSQETKK